MLHVDMAWTELLVAMCIEATGALLQGTFGFGINLVSAPLLVLVSSQFVPGPIVIASLVSSGLVALREKGNVDRTVVSWALVGRVPGTVLGALVLVFMASARLGPVVGSCVLFAVVVTMIKDRMPRYRSLLVGVGVVSGIMNMVAGLGGTPFALICSDMSSDIARPTISAYVVIGGTLSALVLVVIGRIGMLSLELSMWLLPGVFGGVGLSKLVIGRMDRTSNARYGVLAIATAGAVVALVKGPW